MNIPHPSILSARPLRRLAVLLLALMLIAALLPAASAQESPLGKDEEFAQEEENGDPFEGFNRAMFDFNLFLDDLIGKPLAEIYRNVLPEPVRDSFQNFMRNLRTPVILVNDLLQGEGERANETTTRFLINTTLGVGGLFDVAFDMGLTYHSEDFGQTLAVHGVGEGPYLVLPILGPSNFRDAAGKAVDSFLHPLTYLAYVDGYEIWTYGLRGTEVVDVRSRNIETIDQLQADALDFYSLIRSVYLQHRQSEIRNGRPENDSTKP
ncbi:MAG: VacJ family lipoprotein [bacterium]